MHRIPAHATQGQFEEALASKPSEKLGAVLLDTLGLAETIEWHARRFQKCTGIPCELTVSNAAGFGLPEDYAAAMFDICSDAIRSVARHAAGRRDPGGEPAYCMNAAGGRALWRTYRERD